MLDALRLRLARAIAPPRVSRYGVRMYAGARASRLSSDWRGQTGSADAELSTSLAALRNRSRELIRDNAYAKRAQQLVVNNVIGTGIGFEAAVENRQRRPVRAINDAIEAAWAEWCEARYCHTGATLAFPDIERWIMSEVFAAGDTFIRFHRVPFRGSRVPLALELVESERLAENGVPSRGLVRLGIEVDQYAAPVKFWVNEQHPGEPRQSLGGSNRLLEIPAVDMLHVYAATRWPQSRGEPWLHATLDPLRQTGGYVDAEVVAARAAAAYMGFIKSPETPTGDENVAGQEQIVLEPGVVEHLRPGEDWIAHNPNRPNPNLEGFLRYMLRQFSVGTGPSYASVSGDYSQSNYSSSRLGLLDERDLWRTQQQWFIRNVRDRIYREWLAAAVFAGAIPGLDATQFLLNRAKFEARRYKPRGWSWHNPVDEVDAYRQAVLSGFTTVGRVIAATCDGADLEDIIAERKRELELFAEAGLEFDTTFAGVPSGATPASSAAATSPPADDSTTSSESEDANDGTRARLFKLRGHA